MDEQYKLNNTWSEERKNMKIVNAPYPSGSCRLELSHASSEYQDCYLQETIYANYLDGLTSQNCSVTSPHIAYGMTSLNSAYDEYYDDTLQYHESDKQRFISGSHEISPIRCEIRDHTNESFDEKHSVSFIKNHSLDVGEKRVVSCMKIHSPDESSIGSSKCARYLKTANSNNSFYSPPVSDLFDSSSLTSSHEQYLALLKDGELDESTIGGVFFEDGVPYQCSTPLSYSGCSGTSVKSELFSTDYFKGADDDDVIRKRRRREQNRRAARKCREKKKENVDNMLQEYSDTLKENARLRMEMDGLQSLVVKLQTIMRRHQLTCNLHSDVIS